MIRGRFLIAFVLLVCCRPAHGPQPHEPADAPRSHPFAHTVKGVHIGADAPPEGSGKRERPAGLVATQTRTYAVDLGPDVLLSQPELVATPEVPQVALKHLAESLRPLPKPVEHDKGIVAMLRGASELQAGQPEVLLPIARGPDQQQLFLAWPDQWFMVRPGVLRLLPGAYSSSEPPGRDDSVGLATAALTGSWTQVDGVLSCQPAGRTAVLLTGVTVELGGQADVVDAGGSFRFTGSFSQVDRILIRYQGTVTSGGASSPIRVMDEWHQARTEWIDTPSGTTTGSTLVLDPLTVGSSDCELFHLGRTVLGDYHTAVAASPPAGDLRLKRWWGDLVTGPYSYHDYTLFPADILDENPTRLNLTQSVFHEFGHVVRHAGDGDLAHWQFDNFRWAYGRAHPPTTIFNEHFAFNEGWATYWACARHPVSCFGVPAAVSGPNLMDWNEHRVAQRLLDLANEPGVGHAMMDVISRTNREAIHRLWDFEVAYCRTVPIPNANCNAGDRTPTRVKTECPDGFDDHGATCYQPDVRPKPSSVRGAGTLPIGCEDGDESGLFCYQPCPDGWDGIGPVCWQDCLPGMHDDGAFCRRDVDIRGANTNACPGWDACGLTFAAGCSECPAGYHNDGCTCRIDAWIYTKNTFARGAGTLPTDCGPGREYDSGLCYPPCAAGFSGVGPVCWGTCDPGFEDHGATCWRPPNILVKL